MPLTENEYPAVFYQQLLHAVSEKDSAQAFSFLEKEIRRHEELGHASVAVNLQIVKALFLNRYSFAKGFVELQNALSDADVAGLHYEQALIYFEMGTTAQEGGQNELALKCFLNGIKVAEAHHFPALAFEIYYRAGHLQYESDNFPEAVVLLEKGLNVQPIKEWAELDQPVLRMVMSAYNTIGLAYMRSGEYIKSLAGYRNALKMAAHLNDEFWQGLIQGNMGNVHLKKTNYDSALLLLNIDLRTSKKFNSKRSAAFSYISIAEIHENQGDFAAATTYYDSAGSIIEELKMPHPGYYIRRAELSYRMNDHKSAIEYGFKYKVQNDSLTALKKSKALALLQAGFDFENKLGELNLLEKESQLKDKELNYKNLVIVGSTIIVLILIAFIILLLRSNRMKVRMNEMLENEVNRRTRKLAYTIKELDTVVYRLSHDFRRPLTTLIGLDHLGRSLSHHTETQEIFDKIGKTARQMDKMLYKMTFVHEINNQKPKFDQVNLHQLVKEVASTFESELSRCNIHLQESIDPGYEVKSDPTFLRIIVSNLLENAIVYSADMEKACIRVSSGILYDEWFLEIEDNGIGIAEAITPRIYEPFFRGSAASEGNGLGLYLVKRATRRLKGRISMRSAPQNGSIFTVYFPLEPIPSVSLRPTSFF